MILGDTLLSITTWWLGGFAGEMALALETSIETVKVGLQITSIGVEFGFNLFIDRNSLIKKNGKVN
jgi:hypothetical protein